MGYQKIIKAATKCTNDEAVEIEDIMRHEIFHSTLDWQTEAQLKRSAKKAFKILNDMGGKEGRDASIQAIIDGTY